MERHGMHHVPIQAIAFTIAITCGWPAFVWTSNTIQQPSQSEEKETGTGERNGDMLNFMSQFRAPGFIVGTEPVPGALDVKGLKELIARGGNLNR